MGLADNLLKLTKQLYPTGKAFKVPYQGWLESLHIALAKSEAKVIDDSIFLLWSILPDNDDFTSADASQWETRLGMIVNDSIDLEVRKLAIKRKMNHPSTIKARQHKLYLQKQLQDAGFDLYVHENIPEDDPQTIPSLPIGTTQLIQLGDSQLGDHQLNDYIWVDKIANKITAKEDLYFNIGSTNYRSIFFIGGPNIGEFADVDSLRKEEFRQLVLNIKPAQTIAYLLINYTY